MNGATRLDLLTKDFCDGKIRELTEQKNKCAFGWGKSEKEEQHVTIQIAVWERLKEHLNNGEIITINEKEEVTWWSDTKAS